MDFLGLLLNALPGSYAKSLELIFSVMAKAKEALPEEADQIQWATDQLYEMVAPYLSREGVFTALTTFIAVMSNPKAWGKPNPGAAAIQ